MKFETRVRARVGGRAPGVLADGRSLPLSPFLSFSPSPSLSALARDGADFVDLVQQNPGSTRFGAPAVQTP